ncbi:hypothetical protein Rleg4DRAFT_2401 [Rhizobium leguminosarum bv. trifolii WSM2297]|uniref:Uncharacterized protein n=1 Tax=Rhizobium leguminosarum bv. trifolii WSM2297 TaxID=754762 RepID=J0CMI0_RHILT|nr:hypothetical protein [Rhizobium leguminosarum]EJC80755.1 hypothetical protein Rleg4DRAFT_2401 [Rhizobium leguminosarum bv. trifolii WSM2297]
MNVNAIQQRVPSSVPNKTLKATFDPLFATGMWGKQLDRWLDLLTPFVPILSGESSGSLPSMEEAHCGVKVVLRSHPPAVLADGVLQHYSPPMFIRLFRTKFGAWVKALLRNQARNWEV